MSQTQSPTLDSVNRSGCLVTALMNRSNGEQLKDETNGDSIPLALILNVSRTTDLREKDIRHVDKVLRLQFDVALDRYTSPGCSRTT